MKTSSYYAIINHITQNLQKVVGPLPADKIPSEISNMKLIINSVGLDLVAKILSVEKLETISEEEWIKMERELETHFNVKMKNGILIQGEEQRERDSNWWSSVEKQKGDNYYWNRYKSYLGKAFPPEVVKTIDEDTDVVMNNIENPSVPNFSRYGMVVGHVQSGKTGNYSSLICKAADAGYKFIVVIAGGINNLRNQTQERLNEAFIGETKGTQVGAGKGNTNRNLLPLSLTTIERDFNKQDADRISQGLNFDNISVPILLVIKKNTRTLENVINWIEKQYKNQVSKHAMLLIDDESDYASINTKEEEDPTIINKKLRKLLSLFYKSAYVAYTATPYANIFIDHEAEKEEIGRDLFPKDFIYALDAPSNYFGARKIFLNSEQRHLVPITDNKELPENHKIDFDLTSLPESLLEAVGLFFLNITLRQLRGQGHEHNSMLVHATRFTRIHQKLAILIEDYCSKLKKAIHAFGKLPNATNHSAYIKNLKETLLSRHPNIEFSWEEVLNALLTSIDSVIVREVHTKSQLQLEYREDITTNAIVVGGASLSRGFTLKGLSVSYFLRNTVFYDTLMQMGRWFGFRNNYEDLCKIYMTPYQINNFAFIIEATEDLYRDFEIMAENNKTPNDFGLAVQQHPDSALQITARNKQKNVHVFEYSMKLDGKSKETSSLSLKENAHNINVIKELIEKLKDKDAKVGDTIIWKKRDKSFALEFLKKFVVYKSDPLGLTSRMPIGFIIEYAEANKHNWDIALYSGIGDIWEFAGIKKERRDATLINDYIEINQRQVSSGNAESVALNEVLRKELGSNRKLTRQKMERPLLMLHILETNIEPELAAFGVSFPGDALTQGSVLKKTIDTVYYKLLEEELNNEKASDD